MDALTWFKSVFHRAPAPSGADSATDAVVPLHVAAARLRPPAVAPSDDEDWGVLIARAKMQAASPKAPFPPPLPPPRHPSLKLPAPPPPRPASPETDVTPPPSPGRQVPPPFKTRGTVLAERANSTLDAFIQGRRKGTTAPRLALVRPAEEERATPPPIGKFRPTHAFGRGPAGR